MTRLRVLVPATAVVVASLVGGGYAVAQGADASRRSPETRAVDQGVDGAATAASSPIELPETQRCMSDAGFPHYLGTGNLEGPIAAALDKCLPEPEPATPAELAAKRAEVARFTDRAVRCMTAEGFHPKIDDHPEGGTFDPPGSGFVITYPEGEMLSKGFDAASRRCA